MLHHTHTQMELLPLSVVRPPPQRLKMFGFHRMGRQIEKLNYSWRFICSKLGDEKLLFRKNYTETEFADPEHPHKIFQFCPRACLRKLA